MLFIIQKVQKELIPSQINTEFFIDIKNKIWIIRIKTDSYQLKVANHVDNS